MYVLNARRFYLMPHPTVGRDNEDLRFIGFKAPASLADKLDELVEGGNRSRVIRDALEMYLGQLDPDHKRVA